MSGIDDIGAWASIIRSEKPCSRLGRWRWRRRWQRAQARAFLAGQPGWYDTLRAANLKAGVWE